MATEQDALGEVVEQICSMLRSRPDACDTLDGVCAFWARADRRLIERALSILIDRGLLNVRSIGGKLHYSARTFTSDPS